MLYILNEKILPFRSILHILKENVLYVVGFGFFLVILKISQVFHQEKKKGGGPQGKIGKRCFPINSSIFPPGPHICSQEIRWLFFLSFVENIDCYLQVKCKAAMMTTYCGNILTMHFFASCWNWLVVHFLAFWHIS